MIIVKPVFIIPIGYNHLNEGRIFAGRAETRSGRIISSSAQEDLMGDVEVPNVEELNEHRQEEFTKRVALVTALFAVMLAICSLGGNNAMKEMLLAQQQGSDQWAFYQSKVIREHLYRIEKLRFDAELLERKATMRPEVRQHYDALLKKATEEEARYAAEKKEIEAEAKRLDAERDKNQKKDPYFDYAEVLLQIAIVMASISILSRSRQMFYFALGAAGIGTILTLNGYLLLFQIPFLH